MASARARSKIRHAMRGARERAQPRARPRDPRARPAQGGLVAPAPARERRPRRDRAGRGDGADRRAVRAGGLRQARRRATWCGGCAASRRRSRSPEAPRRRGLFRREPRRSTSGIRVSGQADVLVRFPRCCAPLPGDDVIGFVSRGRGVTVHQKDCVKTFELDPARRIDVQWDTDATAPWSIKVRVHSLDRPGLLAKVTKTISAAGINIGARAGHDHRGRQGDPDLRPVGERRRELERRDEGDRADQGDPVRRTPADVTAPVSACVIARDDALHIQRCLDSLAWADETVVVIDERSRDDSEALAQRSGARVLRRRLRRKRRAEELRARPGQARLGDRARRRRGPLAGARAARCANGSRAPRTISTASS